METVLPKAGGVLERNCEHTTILLMLVSHELAILTSAKSHTTFKVGQSFEHSMKGRYLYAYGTLGIFIKFFW